MFSSFDPADLPGDPVGNRMAIYHQVALGNDWQFRVRDSYTAVWSWDTGESALVSVYGSPVLLAGDGEGHDDATGRENRGILACDSGLSAYVALELDGEAVSKEQAAGIAESIRFSG